MVKYTSDLRYLPNLVKDVGHPSLQKEVVEDDDAENESHHMSSFIVWCGNIPSVVDFQV